MQFIFLSVGFILLLGTVWGFIRTKKLLKNGVTTTAKITDVVEEQSTSTDVDGYSTTTTHYYPVLQFKTTEGVEIEFKSNVGVGNKNKYKIGQELEIVYDPGNPEKAKVKSFMQLWLIPIILFAIGAIFLIVGALM